MMERLVRRAEDIGRARLASRVAELSARLRQMLGEGSVQAEDSRILVRGRGLVKRWLSDPSLRFLNGGSR
jgi:hypothetical protein